MRDQVHRFTDHGMYRDPNDPFTYDITTRLQFTISLAMGYDGMLVGPYHPGYAGDQKLQRDALAAREKEAAEQAAKE